MNILLLTGLFPPNVGGAATYFAMLLRYLSREPGMGKKVVLAEWIKNRPLIDHEDAQTVIWRCLPPRDSREVRGSFQRSAFFLATHFILISLIPLILTKYRIDIVHVHSRLARGYLRTITRAFRVGCIVDLRDRMFRAKNIRKADTFICASDGVFDEALRQGLAVEKITKVPIPFEPLRPSDNGKAFLTRWSLRRPYICFVGNISRSKGIFELIEAFEGLKEVRSKFSLVLAGGNREGERFLRLINGNEGIKYIGKLASDEVAALIEHAELLVLPSKSEGLPRVCLEAMSLGKKVICPPNVPEFDVNCPECVLKELPVECLQEILVQTLASEHIPSYPFERHDPSAISSQVYATYRRCLLRE